MRAAVFSNQRKSDNEPWVRIQEVARPSISPGHLLLRVLACGVCRTDLHIVDRELPPRRPHLIPGHQIAGEVVESASQEIPCGTRVGVSWIGGVDGTCWYCRHEKENLCDQPTFTGYTVDGGFAEYTLVREDFAYPLPSGFSAVHAAPLLCAGIIGFRSLRVAEVQRGERVGLFGFGSSAGLVIQVLRAWECETYVVTRGEKHRKRAESLGANWVGDEEARVPVELDRAITFAPSGRVVVDALASLRKGGVLAINAIHLDRMPSFDYDRLLWGERQIRSVANMTRDDAHHFLEVAGRIRLTPEVVAFPLDRANDALLAVKNETAEGSVVIVP